MTVAAGMAHAAPALAQDTDANDPLEPINRVFFQFNEAVQTILLRPVATFYTAFIPPPIRDVVGSVLENLNEPVYFVNNLLQGDTKRAGITLERFVINSTFGLGGTWDAAATHGLEVQEEDFGQTLAVWGMGEGFYLVLPLFGPSNPRDAVGKLVVDRYFDPLGLYLSNTDRDAESWSRTAVSGVHEYAGVMDELDQIRKTSIDYYAALRSMYRQKRESEISNGAPSDLPPIPDLSYEFEGQPGAKGAPQSADTTE
ncbi:MAG: VacJ family lipoprotein [Rhodobacterales bacterium]|nr:VacJ family lipoprotein [Rhodobacterales bacterium]